MGPRPRTPPADPRTRGAADGPPDEDAVENAAGGPAAESGGALTAVAEHDALAGAMAWEALRIEAGRPRRAREIDERGWSRSSCINC